MMNCCSLIAYLIRLFLCKLVLVIGLCTGAVHHSIDLVLYSLNSN
jgi:hypothetical protein